MSQLLVGHLHDLHHLRTLVDLDLRQGDAKSVKTEKRKFHTRAFFLSLAEKTWIVMRGHTPLLSGVAAQPVGGDVYPLFVSDNLEYYEFPPTS